MPALSFLLLGVDAHANMVGVNQSVLSTFDICFLRSGRTSGSTQMGRLVSYQGPSAGLPGAPRSLSLNNSVDVINEVADLVKDRDIKKTPSNNKKYIMSKE